jgi:hypothetical protein
MSGLGVFYQMGLKHKEKLKVDIEVRPTIEVFKWKDERKY